MTAKKKRAERDEHVFYEDETISITSARAIMFGTTYPMANITSVRMIVEARPLWPLFLGVALLLGGTFGLVEARAIAFGALCIIGGIGAIAFHVLRGEKYWICIATAGAETNAAYYDKQEDTEAVIAALNEAIVHRG